MKLGPHTRVTRVVPDGVKVTVLIEQLDPNDVLPTRVVSDHPLADRPSKPLRKLSWWQRILTWIKFR